MKRKHNRTTCATEPVSIESFGLRETNTDIMIEVFTKTTGGFRFVVSTDITSNTQFILTGRTGPRFVRCIAQMLKFIITQLRTFMVKPIGAFVTTDTIKVVIMESFVAVNAVFVNTWATSPGFIRVFPV